MMLIDGVFVQKLQNELNKKLESSRLEKITQIQSDSFLFKFYNKGEKNHLIIDISPAHFSTYITTKTHPQNESSQFLQTLKKHLEGGILNHIIQYQTDRVLIFTFTVYDFIDGPTEKKLIFELMGKHSNLILTQDDHIIDTYKKMFFESGRQLIPGALFEHFPTDKKPFVYIDYDDITSPKEMTQTYMGLSLKLSTYIYPKRYQISDLPFHPTKNLTKQTGYFMDIFGETDDKQHYQNLSKLLDDQQFEKPQFKQTYEIFIKKQLDKIRKKYANISQNLTDANLDLKAKDSGDLIYMSGENLNVYLSEITVQNHTIQLDPTLTLNENAQNFYKIYQKAKRSISYINTQLKDTDQLIQLFESYQAYLEMSSVTDLEDFEKDLIPYGYKTKQKTNKKQKAKPKYIEIIDDDAIYLIGKNDQQNLYVTHELGKPNDTFFHVKDAPGSHLILKTDHLSEKTIRKAAMLAAYFSSLRYSSSIPVDYTAVKNLKKIPKVPGYKVLLKNHKTIFIDIDDTLIKTYL